MTLMTTEDRSKWNNCALCGKTVHPWQETSAQPLADGIACVSCAFNQVDATRKNHGIPSHKVTQKDPQTGRWSTVIVADDIHYRKTGGKK